MGSLSVFVIVFREVLEIVLTLVLVALGTQSIPNRNRWLVFGLLLGVITSCIVGYSIDRIAEGMSGVGQEVLQGLILGISTLLIVYTVVWMKRHSREIAQSVKTMSAAVVAGQKPLFALSMIIALTVLRDGTEVAVLFQGLKASGVSLLDLLAGAGAALLCGSAVGWATYRGVIKLKIQGIFTALSVMLIFLAAGMAAQSAGFLSSAGVIPELKGRLWDTSWIIDDRSFMGQLLHMLVGYSARPSAMQVIWYSTTLVVATTLLFSSYKRHLVTYLAVGLLLAGSAGVPEAKAIDLIYPATIHEGEVEVELRGTLTDDHRSDEDNRLKTIFGVGYGINSWWATEINAVLRKEPSDSSEVTAVQFENRFQLTEQGEYAWNVGLYGEYEFSTVGHATDVIEAKVLLDNEWGDLLTKINLIAEREVGKNSSDDIEGEIAASTRYRLNPALEPGIEYQAGFGPLDDTGSFNSQEHLLGPVIEGRIAKGVKYELAFLVGVSDGAPDRVLRWMIEYEFYANSGR